MRHSPDLSRVQAALTEAEIELQELGSDLQFLVSAGGTVEVARRRRTSGPAEPIRRVARLKGCDSLMWRLARADGDLTLGAPYAEPSPPCAVGGEAITRVAPLGLYLRGRPVCARHARNIASLPALVHDLLAAGGRLLGALGESAARLEEIDNVELRDIVAATLARELTHRLLPVETRAPAVEEARGGESHRRQ